MVWKSTLETPMGISMVEVARSVWRDNPTTRGRGGIGKGVLRGGDLSR